jgi:hypothetical protein
VLLREGAAVVRTRVVAEKTLRGLLALGLIVLVEGKLEDDDALKASGFAVVDAAAFANPGELLEHLRKEDVLASSEGITR